MEEAGVAWMGCFLMFPCDSLSTEVSYSACYPLMSAAGSGLRFMLTTVTVIGTAVALGAIQFPFLLSKGP